MRLEPVEPELDAVVRRDVVLREVQPRDRVPAHRDPLNPSAHRFVHAQTKKKKGREEGHSLDSRSTRYIEVPKRDDSERGERALGEEDVPERAAVHRLAGRHDERRERLVEVRVRLPVDLRVCLREGDLQVCVDRVVDLVQTNY